MHANNLNRARDALHAIPPDLPRDQWVKAGMAAHAAGLDFDTFNDWSAGAATYKAPECRATWRSFKTTPGGVGAGALFGMANDHGGHDGNRAAQRPAQAPRKPLKPPREPAKGNTPDEVWGRSLPATNAHGYIVSKRAAGVPLDTLRVLPAGDGLRIAGESMAGALVVPAYAPDGTLQAPY